MIDLLRRSSSAVDCSVSDFEDQLQSPTENGVKSESSRSPATTGHHHSNHHRQSQQQQQQRENELHKVDDANSSASSSASPFPCSSNQGVGGGVGGAYGAVPVSAASSPEVHRSHPHLNQPHQNGHHPQQPLQQQQQQSSHPYYSFSSHFRGAPHHSSSFFGQSGDDAGGSITGVHRLSDFLGLPSSVASLTSSSSSSLNRHQSPASSLMHPTTDNRLYMTHLD